jgi:hypothetical protein
MWILQSYPHATLRERWFGFPYSCAVSFSQERHLLPPNLVPPDISYASRLFLLERRAVRLSQNRWLEEAVSWTRSIALLLQAQSCFALALREEDEPQSAVGGVVATRSDLGFYQSSCTPLRASIGQSPQPLRRTSKLWSLAFASCSQSRRRCS